MAKFKIGDRVVCRTPTIVCEEFKDKVGVIKEICDFDKSEETFTIEYDCGKTQEAFQYQDGVELLTTPFTPKDIKPLVTGGPSPYYDFPFDTFKTTNDMMEFLADKKWGKYGIHLKDIFKGLCRWGDKDGTDLEYDARKIIYYGVRVLRLAVGNKEMRNYLQELLDNPQFKEINNE